MNTFFSHSLSKQIRSHIVKRTNPHHHWNILLSVFACVGCALFVFSLYLLFQIKNDTVFREGTVAPTETQSVDVNILEKVTNIFDFKKTRHESVKINPTVFSDPSI